MKEKKVSNSVNGFMTKTVSSNELKPVEYVDDGTRYQCEILKFNRDVRTENLHPTQKPVALLEYLIKTYTNKDQVILDMFMGSGSTGVACIKQQRKFIGIELDESYFNIAKSRIEKNHNELNRRLF